MTAEHDRWADVRQEPVVALGWAGRIAAEAERLRELGVEPAEAWCRAAGVPPEPTGGAAQRRCREETRRAAGLLRQLQAHLADGPTTAAALAEATGAGAAAIRHHLREIAVEAGVIPARGRTPATQLWALPGHPAATPTPPRLPVLDRVVSWVASQGRPVTTGEIAAGTGCPVNSVANVCRRAEHRKLMRSVGVAEGTNSILWEST